MTNSSYTETWLGTRLARDLLDVADPHSHLQRAHEDNDPLLKLAQITHTTMLELDGLDEQAEQLRQQLARWAEHSGRYGSGPNDDAESARTLADRLESTCAVRSLTAIFLSRLLAAYQTAAQSC